MNATRKLISRATAAVAAALLTGGLTGLAAAPASAEPKDTTLNHTCTFPLIGGQPVPATFHTDLPSQILLHQQAHASLGVSVTLPGTVATALRLQHATSVNVSVSADMAVRSPEGEVPLSEDGGGVKPLDSDGEPLTVSFSPQVLLPAFTKTGDGSIVVTGLHLSLDAKKADGSSVWPGGKDVACTRPLGADSTIARFTIIGDVPPLTPRHFALKGSSSIKAANGTLPLDGTLDALVSPVSPGEVQADLALKPATAELSLLGFLPAKADVVLSPVGKTTGTLAGGVLTSTSKVLIKLPSVSVFGIQVGGGDSCQTSQPAEITLKSTQPGFDPAKGGPIAGTYALSALENCGDHTSFINYFVAGDGNTIDANLSA
ncbi:hypothetical protein J4573_53080 [Actinomadura barringtoniae]|uniref:DUF6801 domain-containing protein n=1 Tax=Actinomadura barringtoniae TaxID=1427535 RepID=A0A939PPS0_9ACTN|nr:DUF6801 domain-containing protein [Actinomadura barringtoniae]MBO2455893.1 hypothetical protein [Actinomadura barringtoniae]